MTTHFAHIIAIATIAATPVLAQSPQRLAVPEDVPGPPFYAQISHIEGFEQEIYHTDDWAAVVFHRQPACVPDDFNLLDGFDFAPVKEGSDHLRVNRCPLTIEGFEDWPILPPDGIAPLVLKGWGQGAVPIYFVRWPELRNAVADRELTITELERLRSLRIGCASLFYVEILPGFYTDPGVDMFARGTFPNGSEFQFQALASGPSIVPKEVRIVFSKGARPRGENDRCDGVWQPSKTR
jgi:hypothetical protein